METSIDIINNVPDIAASDDGARSSSIVIPLQAYILMSNIILDILMIAEIYALRTA